MNLLVSTEKRFGYLSHKGWEVLMIEQLWQHLLSKLYCVLYPDTLSIATPSDQFRKLSSLPMQLE